MKIFLIITGGVSLYFAIMLVIYAILTKISPYDPKTDDFGDGDSNKTTAAFWPLTLPILLIFLIGTGISNVFDKMREDITGK